MIFLRHLELSKPSKNSKGQAITCYAQKFWIVLDRSKIWSRDSQRIRLKFQVHFERMFLLHESCWDPYKQPLSARISAQSWEKTLPWQWDCWSSAAMQCEARTPIPLGMGEIFWQGDSAGFVTNGFPPKRWCFKRHFWLPTLLFWESMLHFRGGH